jgi:Uma2 family endonuclease
MAVADRQHPRKLTYEDYLLFPEDGLRHEIIDGEHYVTATPFFRHQNAVGELFLRLAVLTKSHDLGTVILSPFAVLLSQHDVLVPDLLFVRKENAERITEEGVQGPPDLAVEVLSKSTRRRDETLKLQRYETFGVREYWLADPVRKTVRVYRRQGDRLGLAADLSAVAGDCLTSPLLPGLEIVLAEVFV